MCRFVWVFATEIDCRRICEVLMHMFQTFSVTSSRCKQQKINFLSGIHTHDGEFRIRKGGIKFAPLALRKMLLVAYVVFRKLEINIFPTGKFHF